MHPSESAGNGAENPYFSFDPVAHEYDQSRYLPLEVRMRMAEIIRDAAILTPGQVLLDAGTGTGRFSLPLARLGIPVIGLDISWNMLGMLRKHREEMESETGHHLPLRVVQSDLRRMPLHDLAVGAVLMVHILHLIADWQTVLNEARRVVKPGGRLLLAAQSGERSPVREHYNALARDRGLLRGSIGAHREEIKTWLAAQGATVTQVDTGRAVWTSRRAVSQTLEMLRQRTWSSLWAISNQDNEALLAETTEWARQRYGSLDAVEETEAGLSLQSVAA
jgi:ubiquinone/menaquinone biosynthesis C-methylase UbiE